MPVNTQHPDYIRMLPVWQDMRAVAGGQRAVHAAGEKYLPLLAGETTAAYDARKKRATFFNATWRTIEGLKGMLFRVAPKRKVSSAVEKMLDDVTKSGVDLDTFAQGVAEECLTVGRVGVMVDYPQSDVEGLTVAQVEALNLRPHMAMYKAETIINWSTAWLNNRTVTSRVVLTEETVLPGKDEFDYKTETRYRVLALAPYEAKDGSLSMAYSVRTYRRTPAGKDVLVSGPFFPKMKGAPLPYIPFQFLGVDDTTPTCDEPPLVDLANVNISHYQTTADLEHGAHKTALPQPWANNIQPQINSLDGSPVTQTWYIGAGLWTFPGQTEVGMLEYTGQGLGALEKRLASKELQMAILGARMLEQQKQGVETAQAAGIHRSGEQATLATQGATISKGLKTVLGWFDQWGGGDGNVEFETNKEFFPANMTPEEITAQVQAWQAGAISKEELFYNLQSGGKIRESTDYETHETQIANASPTLLATPTPAAPGGKQTEPAVA